VFGEECISGERGDRMGRESPITAERLSSPFRYALRKWVARYTALGFRRLFPRDTIGSTCKLWDCVNEDNWNAPSYTKLHNSRYPRRFRYVFIECCSSHSTARLSALIDSRMCLDYGLRD